MKKRKIEKKRKKQRVIDRKRRRMLARKRNDDRRKNVGRRRKDVRKKNAKQKKNVSGSKRKSVLVRRPKLNRKLLKRPLPKNPLLRKHHKMMEVNLRSLCQRLANDGRKSSMRMETCITTITKPGSHCGSHLRISMVEQTVFVKCCL
jgi:hypothetical protein